MIEGLHHIAIISSSEESVRFYERLGFQSTFRKEREYDTIVLMTGNGIELEVFIDPRHSKQETEPLGLRHLALKVDRIEDALCELGLESGPIMSDWLGVRFCFIKDPDGLTIEFHE